MRVGILGNGQLARMLALAGKPLGLDFVFYDNNPQGCANSLGDVVHAKLDNITALQKFITQVDIITFENENIPEKTLAIIPPEKLSPPAVTLLTAQDRLTEKQFLENLGIRVPDYYLIDSQEDLEYALEQNQAPLILKTRRNGYDGRGQLHITTREDIRTAWQKLGETDLIAESVINFQREISMIAVRVQTGEISFYSMTENKHENGILHTSIVKSDDPAQKNAETYTRILMEKLGYIGVLGFEFFDYNNQLLANEFAPRVHNTGHWSIDGATTCQFENHLRAICNLPLGDTSTKTPTIMQNIIGHNPHINDILKIPGVHLHIYQKEPRLRRKIGHINICHHDPDILNNSFIATKKLLTG